MEPSRQMLISAELVEQDRDSATFKGKGEVNGNATVSARFMVSRYNLRDRNPALRKTDERLIEHWRHLYMVLNGELNPKALLPAGSGERGARSAEQTGSRSRQASAEPAGTLASSATQPAGPLASSATQPAARRSPLTAPRSQARDGNG